MSASHLRFMYKWRGRLVALPAILLLFWRYGEIEENWVFAAGAVIFLSGVLIRVLAQQRLHYRLPVPVVFTVTGLYSFVRNPIYIGNTLILVSLCFFAELVWFTPLMVIWSVLVYTLAIGYEENKLATQYGEAYAEYLKNVPRWIPRLRPWHAPWQAPAAPSVRRYFWPSVVAELHCFIWPIVFIVKKLV